MTDDTDARQRTYSWEPPQDPAVFGKGRSGLEVMRAMRDGVIAPAPIAATLGFTLIEVEKGRTAFEGVPAEFHYNPFGSVHGGFYSTILDSAFGTAVLSALGPGVGFTTLEFKINLVRPMFADTGPVRAEAWTVHVGSRMATVDGRIIDAAGKLYAHGNSTCMIFDTWGKDAGKNPKRPNQGEQR